MGIAPAFRAWGKAFAQMPQAVRYMVNHLEGSRVAPGREVSPGAWDILLEVLPSMSKVELSYQSLCPWPQGL